MRSRLGRILAVSVVATLGISAPAVAGPADLDPSFGTGGLVIVPGTDRFDPEAAPLLGTDGKVALAGLLRNSSDRVFLARFSPAGQLDSTFGAAGEVHTNVIAEPDRRAATAQTGEGKLIVAGGAANKATVTLQRYLATGAIDTTFDGDGKATATITGSFLKVTSLVALPDGKTLVAAHTDHGGNPRSFVVLRFNANGKQDLTFGLAGVARVAFSGRNATAWDLAPLSNGKIIAAGSVGDGPATNLAVVRLNANGSLDTAFGSSGRVEKDTAPAASDYATSVITDATGAIAVAGPATAKGMAARLTSTGAFDTSFGSAGVLFGGFAGPSTTFVPEDVVADLQGRMLVVGKATTAGQTKWAIARVLRTGVAPIDTTFATGAAQLAPCANTAGFGPTGAAVSSAGRIVILGACNNDGRVAAVRLFGTDAFPTALTLQVLDQAGTAARTTEAGGHERVPLANIDPTAVLGAVTRYASTTLGSGPMGSGPMGSGPMGSGPMGSGPMGSGPMGSGPMGSGPMGSGPMGSGPMGSGPMGSGPLVDQVLISQLPLLTEPSWEERLAPVYAPDPVPPLQTITLGDVYRHNEAGKALVDSLTYGDVDVTRTPLRHASLAAILLTRPLQFIAPPQGGWCAFLQSQPENCSNGVDLSSTTLLALEFAGDDLSAYYANPLSLLKAAGTDLGVRGTNAATLAYLDLRQVDVGRTVLGSRPASQFGPLLACGSSCTGTLAERQDADPTGWTTATIGQLIDHLNANPGLMSLSLGELLVGMVHTGEIPYEQADRRVLLDAAKLRTDNLQTYKVVFDVDCQQGSGLTLTPALPGDARIVPGSGKVAIGTAPATPLPGPGAGGSFALDSACAGRSGVTSVTVTFLVEPGSDLRPSTTTVSLSSAFGQLSRTVPVSVDDSRDPGDSATQTLPLTTDEIVHGWISDSRDVDFYTFPAPPKGTRISITLSHLPADFDLTLFVPGADIDVSSVRSGPMGSGPMGSGPMGSGPLPDSTADAIDPSVVEPDTVQDLPMGSGPMGSGPMGSGPMGSGSINRGTADEAITYVVREADQGKTFAARVDGYNGESSERPYVLRRMDLAPPPALSCPARTGMSNGLAGSAPSSVPADTQTLYLVNSQRLAALNPITEAGQTMAKLEELAASDGPAKGVVVAVDSDADVRAAYGAWDASPCDEEKANDVGERINALVDRLRARSDADGLRQLRSIVLVGPDAVIPQARVRDDSWLSNEFEYADTARLRASADDAIAGALGDGYMLTDQAYGDFDAGRTIFVPDVALGRLVETAGEINAQIARFLERDGLVTPEDAVVMGYDLFSDGASAQGEAFGVQANVGNWNAADAIAAVNRPSTGFTAVNGHYDHFRGMPAAAFSGTGSPSLLHASQTQPQPDSILFTMGCHSGLNISFQNAGTGTGGDDARLGDWAQRMAQHQASWTGSTTYSYGDTETIAYTESILAEMARMLAGRRVTVGQALMYAQHRSVATAGVIDRYFVKSSLALTIYGLPMWRMAEDGVGAATMPELAYETGDGAPTSQPLSFDLTGTHLRRHDTDRGSFWDADGQEPLVAQGHPVQPLASKVVPAASGNAKGYLIESLKTEDIEGVDPVFARPTVDLEAHEPEPMGSAAFFPSRLASVTTEATPEGRSDRVTVAAGQFRGSRQRLFRSIGGRILRFSTDKDLQLAIRRVDGEVSQIRNGETVTGHRFSVRVETEGAAALGGNVLYRTNADAPDANGVITWHRQNLAVGTGGLLFTGGVLPGGDRIEEAFVQVYSTTHTIAHSNFKVLGYSFEHAVPKVGDPRIILQPEVPDVGYLTTVPKAVLDPGTHTGARFECRFDGGDWIAVTPGTPFDLPDPKPGEHLIECRGDDGSSGRRSFGIDLLGPTVTAQADREPDFGGWYTGPVTVTFQCADDASGVADADCPAPREIATEGAAVQVTGSATDLAGRTGSGGITLKIDRSKPTLTSSQSPAANAAGWAKDPVTVSWACADAVSGIASCSAPATVAEGHQVAIIGTAKDNAGHEASAERRVSVDAQNPALAFSGDFLLIGSERLTGTASDADTSEPVAISGVADVIVRYQRMGLLGPSGPVIERSVANGGVRLTCDAATAGCTWDAAGPGSTGTFRVTAFAKDTAGRTGTMMTGTLSVS